MAPETRIPIGFRELVERLGGHPVDELGIDLTAPDGPERWFVASCVLAERAPAGKGQAAVRALAGAGLLVPQKIAEAGPEPVQLLLEGAQHPSAAPLAHRVARASRGLVERYEGSFDALAGGCDDLEALGRSIAALASGIGTGTVLRFLRPLRARWTAAGECPLDPAAQSAAVHLGWLDEGDDGGAATLAARLADEADPPPLADLEAALARLGSRSCRRGDPRRCSLGEDCPAR